MKHDLDDLILQSFRKKEKISPEFSRSVMNKMKTAKETAGRNNRGLVVAACVGILLVAGMTALVWKDNPTTQKEKGTKTVARETNSPASSGENTDDSVGEENTDKSINGAKGQIEKNGKEKESSQKEVSRVTATKNPVATRRPKEDIQKEKKKRNSSEKQNVPRSEKKPSTEKQKSPSVNQLPRVTAAPDAVEPVVAGSYIDLCSMKEASPDTENDSEAEIAFSRLFEDEMFGNQKISSYEELQDLIGKAKKECKDWNTPAKNRALNWIIQQLEQYDTNYFEKNALYLYNVYCTYGYDFKLSAVNVVDQEDGKKLLDIQLDRVWTVGDDEAVPCVMCYYCCFVQVPRNIADACDSTKFVLRE